MYIYQCTYKKQSLIYFYIINKRYNLKLYFSKSPIKNYVKFIFLIYNSLLFIELVTIIICYDLLINY